MWIAAAVEGLNAAAEVEEPGGVTIEQDGVHCDVTAVRLGFEFEVGFELMALVEVVQGFDGLLERDGDEEAEGDGADMNPEIFPGMERVVGWVDFHARDVPL